MNIWDQLVDCICRPPRDVYSQHELLGGLNQTFLVGQMECTRIDFELVRGTNKQGQKLACSHYLPLDAKSQDGQLPVVVYCHCNSGSRRDAEEALYHLLPCGVGVVAFDFTGSGLSDGKWVTLGAHEVEDLAVVVQHLRAQGGISSIGLWGRSMGAVTALLYSHQDPDIAGMVLDSPFSRLTDLMLEIVVSQRLPIPKVMLKLALRLMRNSVRRKAGADINLVSPLDVVARSVVPAMFGHGEEDSFINMQHSVKLYEAYNSAAASPVYKNLVRFKGDHNHPRPSFFYSSVCCFFHQQLKLDQVLLGGNPADSQQLMQYGSLTLSAAHDPLDRANGFINTPWSLEPVASMTPEEHAAAAAATAALLADEGSSHGASSGAGDGGVAAAANSSGNGSGVGSLRLAVPSRRSMQQSNGGGPGQGSNAAAAGAGAAGVVHISEGGLNSPRASAGRERGHVLVSVEAGGVSSSGGSSGGGMLRAGAVAGSGPGSPISPVHLQHHSQHQRHIHHHHHHHNHAQQHQHQRHGDSRPAHEHVRHGLDQGVSWHLPAATAAAAAAAAGGAACSTSQPAGIGPPAHSNEQLFPIGSRGAGMDILGQPAGQDAANGADMGGTPAAAAAAAAGAAAASESGASKGHLRWLFKRNSSGSAAGSTPSTPPDFGSARAKSAGACPSNGRQEGFAPQGQQPTTSLQQQQEQEQEEQLQQNLAVVLHQQQQQQHHHSRSLGYLGGSSGLQLGGTGSRSTPGVVPTDLMQDDVLDADLAAAIAASLAEQQQQQQQQLSGAAQQPQWPQQLQQPSGRLPQSADEEEQMLREAIALSLALADPPLQQAQQEQQQQPSQLDLQHQQQQPQETAAVLHQHQPQQQSKQPPSDGGQEATQQQSEHAAPAVVAPSQPPVQAVTSEVPQQQQQQQQPSVP